LTHKYKIIAPQIELNVVKGASLSSGKGQKLLWILPDASQELKRALEIIAFCFKSEMRFDWIQYAPNEHVDDSCIGFIIIQQNRARTREFDFKLDKLNIQPHYVIGGGCFRKIFNNEMQLDFIWLHPYDRHRGVMQAVWKKLKIKFDKFELAKPVSSSMTRFIEMNKNYGTKNALS